jgi:hypothetical protein
LTIHLPIYRDLQVRKENKVLFSFPKNTEEEKAIRWVQVNLNLLNGNQKTAAQAGEAGLLHRAQLLQTNGEGGEKAMLQITGKEAILLPTVLRMDVSEITNVGEGVYQRVIRFVTEEGILELSIEANKRATIAFAADPLPYNEPLPLDNQAYD